jgi:hypothetical protein
MHVKGKEASSLMREPLGMPLSGIPLSESLGELLSILSYRVTKVWASRRDPSDEGLGESRLG